MRGQTFKLALLAKVSLSQREATRVRAALENDHRVGDAATHDADHMPKECAHVTSPILHSTPGLEHTINAHGDRYTAHGERRRAAVIMM